MECFCIFLTERKAPKSEYVRRDEKEEGREENNIKVRKLTI